MSRNRYKKNKPCARAIPSPQRIHIQMSSGVVVDALGWTLADRTFVAPPSTGAEAETVTFEVYLLTTHAVMVRVYHRAEPIAGVSVPVQVWTDVTGRCGTVDAAIEFVAGLGWPAPMVDRVREEAHQRREDLERQGVRVHPWKAAAVRGRRARASGFTILAGSTIPA